MAGPDQLVTCWDCHPPTEWKPEQLAGHGNKHRLERKRAAQALDSSSIPSEAKVTVDGETSGEAPVDVTPEYEPAQVKPVVVHRPKVADALIPYLGLVGVAVHQRNAYDGAVISHGIPGFVTALDDVAQENDTLYRLLNGIKAGDSPNFRLALATLAIIVPILANHREDSGALRNLVGALRIMPGTDIPALPKKADVPQAEHDVAESMVGKMRETLDNMSPEDAEAVAEAMSQIPPDLIERMVKSQTVPTSMDHPEFLSEPEPVSDGET